MRDPDMEDAAVCGELADLRAIIPALDEAIRDLSTIVRCRVPEQKALLIQAARARDLIRKFHWAPRLVP